MKVRTDVSLTGILAMMMAFAAMVGGWYKFDYRQLASEQRLEVLEREHSEEVEVNARLNDTLVRTNVALAGISQALEDKGIHVRARLPGDPGER